MPLVYFLIAAKISWLVSQYIKKNSSCVQAELEFLERHQVCWFEYFRIAYLFRLKGFNWLLHLIVTNAFMSLG